MAQLEQAGLVRLSQDTIQSNRIVAITAKGRQELKR
jgi:DNA-binding MarR family transcriptional regulator